jgi:hypothetical protein
LFHNKDRATCSARRLGWSDNVTARGAQATDFFARDDADTSGRFGGLRQMMADRAKTDQQGRNARALFEREFTLEAAGEKYAKVLQAAFPPGSPAPKPSGYVAT